MQDTTYFGRIVTDHEGVKWKKLARTPEDGGNISKKIEAIKEFRHLTGAGLKAAKDAVEEYTARLETGGPVGMDLPKATKTINFPGGYLTISPSPYGYVVTKTTVEELGRRISDDDLLQYVADTMRTIGVSHGMPRA